MFGLRQIVGIFGLPMTLVSLDLLQVAGTFGLIPTVRGLRTLDTALLLIPVHHSRRDDVWPGKKLDADEGAPSVGDGGKGMFRFALDGLLQEGDWVQHSGNMRHVTVFNYKRPCTSPMFNLRQKHRVCR